MRLNRSLRKMMVLSMLTLLGMGQLVHGQSRAAAADRQAIGRGDQASLTWRDAFRSITLDDGTSVLRPDFTGSYIDSRTGLPWFRTTIEAPAGGGQLRVRLADPVFESLPNDTELRGVRLPAAVEPRAFTMTIAKRPQGVVRLMPLRRNASTGQVERLVRFRLVADWLPEASASREAPSMRRAASNSVLADGTWLKIAVAADGIYRVDYDFLQEQGLNPDGLDPSRLAIFGNGGGMVPEDNGIPRPDDLLENATQLVGGADGSFDPGDYLLFYGQAADRIRYDGVNFRQVKNLYEDQTFYFLTTDRGTGKRVSPTTESPEPFDVTVTSFDHVAFLEEDKENLLQSGREWYGDFFDAFTPTRTYSFNIPDRVTIEPYFLEARVGARSAVSSSNFSIAVNGSTVISPISLSTITIGFDKLYATTKVQSSTGSSATANLSVSVSYTGDGSARGWLDYLLVNARRALRMPAAGGLLFRDVESVNPGYFSEFRITDGNNTTVWDVTDPTNAVDMDGLSAGGFYRFTTSTDSLRTFYAWRDGDVRSPEALAVIGPVANQNLHDPSRGFPDYIIVSHKLFLDQARRLAGFHAENSGLDTLVVDVAKVYNEYSNGAEDPSAIRDFVKMFYDRASGEAELPRYLLLFGDASYDFKNIAFDAAVNQDFIPSFQSVDSEHSIFSTNTDDFFGFLDPGEGGSVINRDTLGIDIGVGRLPVKSALEAREVTDKILHYASAASLGSWRNTITFVADDEDGDIHRRDADRIATEVVAQDYPVYNVDKIYLDAYQQVSASGGTRYPAANEAINNRIFAGTLIMNYTGHGSEESWAKERVLGETDIEGWDNIDKLALFITATCSFSRFDNPSQTSAGERTLLNASGGAIGLITTVRLVFSYANYQINRAVFETAFEYMPDGSRPTLGDVVRNAKNILAGGTSSSSGNNNRKFALLGDPALSLAYPDYKVVTTSVNGQPVSSGLSDTLSALARVVIEGEVQDDGGSLLSGFQGTLSPTIYDKASLLTTLSNDGPSVSPARQFSLQKNIIYRGNASVTDGRFRFEFIVPKDITYTFGKGKISYYARAGEEDANGFDTTVVIGGTADSVLADDEGPQVNVFLGDESFAFGGITDADPILLVKLEDESGINTVGNGIGHDITAELNEDAQNALVLNDFYEAELDSYQRGQVTYRLQDLEPGRYRIRIGAWDVHNNPGEGYTEFVVAESAELALAQVLNYPNPFTTRTEFLFEHNRPGEPLQVMVEIFSVSGKRIKTIVRDVLTDGFRVSGIEWDGRDDFGDTIGRGVYVYKVSVRSQLDPSLRATAFEKLVMLR